MALRRSIVTLVLFSFCSSALFPQTNVQNSSDTTFQSKVRVVLVDVTVTDHDTPVSGLKKEDFEIQEAGKAQTIASFEVHQVHPQTQAQQALPPNVYSNDSVQKTADSVNVLVMDALNTPITDQAYARQQMVKYLKQIQPGPQLAIFTLSTHLRIVEGFTVDPAVLLAALNRKDWGGTPQISPALPSQTEIIGEQTTINDIAQASSGPMAAAAPKMIEAMEQFMAETSNYQLYARVEMTLQALQQLGRYLSSFPGRKNVIWFSGAFPLTLLPTSGRDYDSSYAQDVREKLRQTTNLLASAQVAIYPIAAAGLTSDSTADTAQRFATSLPVAPGASKGEAEMAETEQGHLLIYSAQNAMQFIARDTGGEAFYNTNGLKEALAKAVNNGSNYYTISYTPTDKDQDGRYRPIQVKVRSGHYKLSYRHGYFADDAKKAATQSAAAQNAPTEDPLQPLMVRGLPESTQILYKVRIEQSGPQPVANSPIAGRNSGLKQPLTRYAVDFAVPTDDVNWVTTQDGKHHGSIEVAVVAYDHDGHTLNWTAKTFDLALRPDRYALFAQSGLQLHQEIDVPKGDVFLRTGVYDAAANKAGTLEVPVGEVLAVAPTK